MLRKLLWMPALDRHRESGPLVFRIFIASVLIYGTQDNVLDAERMLEFRDFLAEHGFPYPLFSARLSVYAQFTCGGLLLVGLLTRWAALVMVVNFVVALAMVHAGQPFSANIAPLAMLFGSFLFLLHGAGPISLDARLRGSRPPAAAGRELLDTRGRDRAGGAIYRSPRTSSTRSR